MPVTLDDSGFKKAVDAAARKIAKQNATVYINDRYERQFLKHLIVTDQNIRREFLSLSNNAAQIIANLPNRDGAIIMDAESRKSIKRLLSDFSARTKRLIDDDTKALWDLANDKNDVILYSFMRDISLAKVANKGVFSRNMDAYMQFIERKRAGMNLSERVWKFTNQTDKILNAYLENGIASGRSANKIAGDIVSILQNPGKIIRVGKKAFSVIDETITPGRGVYKSPYQNARRLARTEINMAYRTADHIRWKETDFVMGFEVKLSNSHPVFDICDYMAGQYPKNFKFVGWHPACLCYAVPVLPPDDVFMDWVTGDGNNMKPVEDLPEGYYRWIEENREKMQNWANTPYFIADNYKRGDIENGLRAGIVKVAK
jgi:hypothetical protein